MQSQNAPAIISHAIAHGKPARPARKAAHWHPGHPSYRSKSSPPTAGPGGTATATPTGTPTATPSGTPSDPPTSTPTGGQSGSDPSGQDPATALSGYTLKYTQEFTGDSPRPAGTCTRGCPAETSSEADWEPSMCAFSGGEAHFMASGIDSCGMNFTGAAPGVRRLVRPPAGHLSRPASCSPTSSCSGPHTTSGRRDRRLRGRGEPVPHRRHPLDTPGNACGARPAGAAWTSTRRPTGATAASPTTDTEWHTYGVEWAPSACPGSSTATSSSPPRPAR